MSRSRKLFIPLFIIFMVALAYASYDISRRTTFPGSKSQLKERLKRTYMPADSSKLDSLRKNWKKWPFCKVSCCKRLFWQLFLLYLKQIKANYRHENPPWSSTSGDFQFLSPPGILLTLVMPIHLKYSPVNDLGDWDFQNCLYLYHRLKPTIDNWLSPGVKDFGGFSFLWGSFSPFVHQSILTPAQLIG